MSQIVNNIMNSLLTTADDPLKIATNSQNTEFVLFLAQSKHNIFLPETLADIHDLKLFPDNVHLMGNNLLEFPHSFKIDTLVCDDIIKNVNNKTLQVMSALHLPTMFCYIKEPPDARLEDLYMLRQKLPPFVFNFALTPEIAKSWMLENYFILDRDELSAQLTYVVQQVFTR